MVIGLSINFVYVDNPGADRGPFAYEKTVLSNTVIQSQSSIETSLEVTGAQVF